jgi:hypothetical protein
MLQQPYGDVYCWTEHHGKPETTYYWYNLAIYINQAGIFALIDPLPMSDEQIPVLFYTDGREWNEPLAITTLMDTPEDLEAFIPQHSVKDRRIHESTPQQII